ncbi:MAG: DUF2797 domain-containing protein [Flavobacteriales bacterium]|jgi:hypothetical protein
MTQITTHLRKMSTTLDNQAQYMLHLVDILDYTGKFFLNPLVGTHIKIEFLNEIHCVETGKKIKKTFGEGMSYDAWLNSPMASPSIVNPELSRIHEGIALRDYEWEMAHHNQPHYVYLSRTSGIKVGVTRVTNVPSRWIDQGASEAIIIAETPYRQLAGLIEVALKDTMADKTAWQAMLKNAVNDTTSLVTKKNEVFEILADQYEDFFFDDDTITNISYPVLNYPQKVKSAKLDTQPVIQGKLMGIKGQYLLFEDGTVFNVRSHAGYKIQLTALE